MREKSASATVKMRKPSRDRRVCKCGAALEVLPPRSRDVTRVWMFSFFLFLFFFFCATGSLAEMAPAIPGRRDVTIPISNTSKLLRRSFFFFLSFSFLSLSPLSSLAFNIFQRLLH